MNDHLLLLLIALVYTQLSPITQDAFVTKSKYFIIGLPRTSTTSACVALIDMGFSVAHTAYTDKCMRTAQVIADTPVFCDYKALDQTYPNSKFIYLERELSLWIPSIRQLLQRMHKNIVRKDGGFNPILKRCYNEIFAPFTLEAFESDEFLTKCYLAHKNEIETYFTDRPADFLSINVSYPESYTRLAQFVGTENKNGSFEKINVGGKITAWNKVESPLKVDSLLR